MSHPFYPSRPPSLNHVAMSVDPELLGEEGRQDLTRFFGEVFGFEPYPQLTVDRQRLVFGCLQLEQFIFLFGQEDHMVAPWMDHYGFSVGTREELQGIEERILEFQKTDSRCELKPIHTDDQNVVILHSLYVRYLLPMTIEIQWWEMQS